MRSLPFKNYPAILSAHDIKEILRTGTNTVYSLLNNNIIKSVKIGGKYRITQYALMDYINKENDIK